MKTVAIIPARGGSERFPNKNIHNLGGIPLLAHSIIYALKQAEIDTVYVSTNDAIIKSIALKYGAYVINRPEALSDAHATTVSALRHVLETVEETYDYVVLLQPTNPLRPENLFKEAYPKCLASDCDSLMTVSRNHQKLGKIVNERFMPFNYTMGQRSQDLEPLYYENGLLYITKASLILKDIILGPNNLPYLVDHPYAVVDIDTIDDLTYAEFILNQYPND